MCKRTLPDTSNTPSIIWALSLCTWSLAYSQKSPVFPQKRRKSSVKAPNQTPTRPHRWFVHCVSVRRALHFRKRALYLCKRALIRVLKRHAKNTLSVSGQVVSQMSMNRVTKRAQHFRKRALHHPQKSPVRYFWGTRVTQMVFPWKKS